MGRKAIGTMTTYEILLMLDPEQAEARQDEIVARARELVEKSGGAWRSHDPWGRRRLAYPIDKKNDGVYHLVVFDSDGATLDEISRVLKIDDAVMRHMATRHVEGSRTSAPRDDAAAAAPDAVPEAAADAVPAVTQETTPEDTAVPDDRDAEYADTNTGSDEE
jgi:small subunit ribosomal protein S6